MNCVGSIQYTRDMPNTSSEYAAEGTLYHTLAAGCLADGGAVERHVGEKHEVEGFKFTVDQENADFAQVYVDAIRRIPGRLYVEVSLDLSAVLGVPEQGGTSDAVVVDLERRVIHAHDLKFGRGETVYATKNKQAMLYALGVLHRFEYLVDDSWTVVIGIHQPRINHYDEWTCGVPELRAFGEVAAKAAQLAYSLYKANKTVGIEADLTATDKGCRWCLKGGSCKVRSQKMLNMFPVVEVDGIARLRMGLSDTELAEMWPKLDALENWINAIRTESLARALNGAELPGLKLVTGRQGARQFTDNMAVEALLYGALGDEAYKPKVLISPTEAGKRFKKTNDDTWTKLQPYITQSPGRQSLAPIEDLRPPVAINTPEFPTAPPTV
jgi:hypothetical protein